MTLMPRWTIVFALMAAACGAGRSNDEIDVDADSDIDTDGDSDLDTGSDTSHCADPPVDCGVTPRADSGAYDAEVCVPGGWFLMGAEADAGFPDTHPRRWVELSPYLLDRHPVTIDRYQACLDAGACPEPYPGYEPSPACDASCSTGGPKGCEGCEICWPCQECEFNPGTPMHLLVTVEMAEAFCAWDERDGIPGRLPTEAELERAFVGLGCPGRRFPWGAEDADCENTYIAPTEKTCPTCDRGRWCEVDGRPAGDSPEGLAALIGTVLFPTLDCYLADFYARPEASVKDPLCGPASPLEACSTCSSRERVWRGLSNSDVSALSDSTRRRHSGVDEHYDGGGGIRCARDGG